MSDRIDFQVDPSNYRHWRLEIDGPVAMLTMDVDEDGGIFEGCELKMNSYDIGVDIELADIVQRMRFEHPGVKVVVMRSGKEKVFCAGANIGMLGEAGHAHKVNFCKFTNETRNAYEAAEEESGQKYVAAVKGSCAGGGYELALACNHIMLVDDSSSSVALPEAPLLGVLPGTGGLTRLTDKRKVRRDLADVFCSTEEGIRSRRALEWGLVDEVVPNSNFDGVVAERAHEFAAASAKEDVAEGIELSPLRREFSDDAVTYSSVEVAVHRDAGVATVTIFGPDDDLPGSMEEFVEAGDENWMLRAARELEDAILHLRLNEREAGLIVFETKGDGEAVAARERLILDNADHWLANEILHYWKRVLKRIDVTSRSMVCFVEHGSCFAGPLAEILWAADRSYMMQGEFDDDGQPMAAIGLTDGNFGRYPMANGLTRLRTRFYGDPGRVDGAEAAVGRKLEAEEAAELGLVTDAFDNIDWDGEVRIFLEARSAFSPDAMSGMEANLRFPGPETMETRIFGRLAAWQNWIFQRPNASGPEGALRRYGSGVRPEFDMERA